jgi:hypothetical protein
MAPSTAGSAAAAIAGVIINAHKNKPMDFMGIQHIVFATAAPQPARVARAVEPAVSRFLSTFLFGVSP